MERFGGELKRTSKVLKVEDAEKILAQQDNTFQMKRAPKYLEDISDYNKKLMYYQKATELSTQFEDTEVKPFTFFHEDAAFSKAGEINRFFEKEVATVHSGKLGNRQSYKINLDTELMRDSFRDILATDGKLLESRKRLAA